MCEVCEIAETREERIAKYRARVNENPDDSRARDRLRENLDAWYEHDVEVEVQVANNEQLPWTEWEIGLRLVPMKLKAESTYRQVGDYIFTVKYQDKITTGSIVVERKSFEDLLGTLKDHEHYIQLVKEVKRFQEDDRFTQFIIFAECNKFDFMNWKPPNVVHYKKRKWDNNYNRMDEAQRLKNHQVVMRGKIGKLVANGASISWEGSREEAALAYNTMVRHWCIHNYEKITGIKTPKECA